MIETLAIISLIGNVVQFVDFASELIAKSTELYRSSKGTLAENVDAETATDHLVLLNNKLKGASTTASDYTLKSLCDSCQTTADELLVALDKVKVNGKQNRWKSTGKAWRSVWSKERIRELEGRLARFREELNLHVTVDLREQVSRLETDHADSLNNLGSTAQGILDAIVKQQDVFEALHDMQIARMETLSKEIVLRADDAHNIARDQTIKEMASNIRPEHAITRREIIEEIRRHEHEASLTHSSKSCWSVPLPRNYHFVGRSSQLRQLEATLFQENHFSKVAIIGLGGVGKTQIALELAYRTKDTRPECSVFWVSATNTENVQQAYLGIAQQLHIPGWEDKKGDVRELVQHYLRQENAGQWLLIFDNADDSDMWLKGTGGSTESTRLIDSLPRSNKGSILFTTRSRKAASKFAHDNVIRVMEMDEKAATEVLRNSLVNKEILDDGPILMQLLRLLTCLPLAIVQAAAYINENDISLAEYLSLFDDREENIIELLSEDFEDEGRYHDVKNPVATTWLISFEQIRARDAQAADYLSLISCVDPKAIPLSLLPPAQTKKKKTDAIGTLSAYSFITKRPTDHCFDVHRLVHLVTRNWLREQKLLSEWTVKTIERIAQVFPDDDHKNRTLWRSYLPHARYVQASNVFRDNVEKNLPWIERFGLCLLSDGLWREAEMPFLLVMETNTRLLGSEHSDTLTSIGNVATTYRNQGRWDKAEELDMQVMEIRKKVLGEKDPSTIASMANLAMTFKYQGRWKEAEKLDIQVMEMHTRVLGKDHDDTLSSMHNLAATYSNQGRWKEAEDIGMQVRELCVKVYGGDHPATLTTMSNLAWTYNHQRRWIEAEELGIQVMEKRRSVLGEEHPHTLVSMNNLMWTYNHQGRWNEAEELGIQVIEKRRSVLGEEHPDTLTSMANLTSTYRNQGRWKEAEELEVQVMEARKRVLGEEHPNTLTSMANLAHTWKSQSRNEEAISLMERCFELQKRIMGTYHPNTETSLKTITRWRIEESGGDGL